MTSNDSTFVGSIPGLYDRCLASFIFEPYAIDLADRVAKLSPSMMLETAAGTGVLTVELAKRLVSGQTIHATDLNQPMLDVAAGKVKNPNVSFRQADATSLPYGDHEFDVVACQFGVMFFPDKLLAFEEALRVLKAGGHFVFNVWDSLELNEIPHFVDQSLASLFADNQPSFFRRVPYGYNDPVEIGDTLRQAGFHSVHFQHITKKSKALDAGTVALGLCQGTPMRGEIEARTSIGLEAATQHVEMALRKRFGSEELVGDIQAIAITATRQLTTGLNLPRPDM